MPSNHRHTAWPVVFFFAFLLVPMLASSQGRGRLIGKLVDPDGKPLENVVVTVTTPEISGFKEVKKTDRRGNFTIDFRHIGVKYTYRFEKDGFQTLEVQQEWDLEGSQRVEWTMVPGASGPAAGGPLATTSQPAVTAYNDGLAAFKAKNYAAAEAKFSEAVGHDPNLLQGWIALTSVHMQTGKNKEAAAAAEKAIALGSTDSAILTARYQAYRNMNDEAKAAEALKDLETIGRRAEEAKKIHNEAVALVKAKDNEAAFAKFQEALKVDPNLQASLIGLATAGLQIGKNEEAATAAETVLKTDAGNEQAIRLRYNACLALGDKDRLAEALVGLAAFEPEVARNGLLKLAFDAFDANDKPQAKASFLKVLKVDPNQPQAHYYLAMVLINEGQTAEAKKYLEKFISLAPNSTEAATAREMLKQIK